MSMMHSGNRTVLIGLLLLTAFMSRVFPYSTGILAYANPLKGDIGVHDPVMIRQDSLYYVFHTGALVQIKTSTDRITWKQRGSVFAAGPSWFRTYVPENDGKDCWAPDISYRDGKFWLYYSVSTFGKRVSAIGLATNATLNSSSPDYRWVDEGMVINSTNSNDYNCIDPNLFVDTDGKVWLSFGSWNTGIKMVELDPETGKLLSSKPTVLSLARRRNTGTGIEAPFIIRHASYYYLFTSWDVCCKGVSSTYNIRAGRAAKVTGPYADKSGVALSGGGGTLVDKGDERWIGPGHNGIFTEHDTVFLVNHAYDAQANGASKLMIRPLYWDKDGWPTLDGSKGEVTPALREPQAVIPVRMRKQLHPVVFMTEGIRKPVDVQRVYSLTGRPVPVGSHRRRPVPGVYLIRQP